MKRSPILNALDLYSYDWLAAQSPVLLSAIEDEIAAGMKPEAVYRMITQYVGSERHPIAIRARQAANHILATQRG